jgi:hypothetical protein
MVGKRRMEPGTAGGMDLEPDSEGGSREREEPFSASAGASHWARENRRETDAGSDEIGREIGRERAEKQSFCSVPWKWAICANMGNVKFSSNPSFCEVFFSSNPSFVRFFLPQIISEVFFSDSF